MKQVDFARYHEQQKTQWGRSALFRRTAVHAPGKRLLEVFDRCFRRKTTPQELGQTRYRAVSAPALADDQDIAVSRATEFLHVLEARAAGHERIVEIGHYGHCQESALPVNERMIHGVPFSTRPEHGNQGFSVAALKYLSRVRQYCRAHPETAQRNRRVGLHPDRRFK